MLKALFGFAKITAGVAGTIAAIVILALPGIGAGAYAMWWWDNRPPHCPSVHIRLLFGCCTWSAPESLKAQLGDLLAAEAAAKRRAQAINARQAAINAQASAKEAAAQRRIRYVTRTIAKEIPTILTPEVDRRFPLSVGFVRVFDAAALGVDLSALPDPAGQPDDSASPVKPSSAASIVNADFGECHLDQERLTGLQEWVRDTAANFNSAPKGEP